MKEDRWGLLATVLSEISSFCYGLGSTDTSSLAFVLLFIATRALSSFCLLEIQGVERGLVIFFFFPFPVGPERH